MSSGLRIKAQIHKLFFFSVSGAAYNMGAICPFNLGENLGF